MDKQKIASSRLDEHYYKVKHPSGLHIYVYPKRKSSTTYAMFGTRYGSIDNCFKRSDEQHPEKVPEGIAHYLEHKLFESEEGDAFTRFAKTGASANAFTSFESTCYLFSGTDKIYESLEVLLDFVQSPYFTKETVAKEQGIIGQEIKMYDDDPQWRVMFNNLGGLYHNHPIKDDIAGTVESIAEITPEYLYRCYNTFYNLNNMALVVVGNIKYDKVMEVCDRLLKPSAPVKVDRIFEEEPQSVVTDYTEQKLSVASPLFQLGFKETVTEENRTVEDIVAMEVLLDVLASDASPLFRKLMDENLINESSFSHEYFEGAGYAAVLIGGESKDPQKVKDIILQEIKTVKATGIDEMAFNRAKKALYGNNVSSLNSTSSIANGIMSLSFKDRELFDYIEAFKTLSLEQVEKKLHDVFVESQSSLSVILPI